MTAAAKRDRADAGTRKALIIKVHVAKRQLGLDKDDTAYRALLEGATGGKSSCTDMDVAELAAVLNALVRAGWRPGPSKAQQQEQQDRRTWIEVPKGIRFERQVRKACAIAVALGWDLDGLNKRMKKQFGVDHIFFVASQQQMQTLLKDLTNRAKRRGLDAYPERRA